MATRDEIRSLELALDDLKRSVSSTSSASSLSDPMNRIETAEKMIEHLKKVLPENKVAEFEKLGKFAVNEQLRNLARLGPEAVSAINITVSGNGTITT